MPHSEQRLEYGAVRPGNRDPKLLSDILFDNKVRIGKASVLDSNMVIIITTWVVARPQGEAELDEKLQ